MIKINLMDPKAYKTTEELLQEGKKITFMATLAVNSYDRILYIEMTEKETSITMQEPTESDTIQYRSPEEKNKDFYTIQNITPETIQEITANIMELQPLAEQPAYRPLELYNMDIEPIAIETIE